MTAMLIEVVLVSFCVGGAIGAVIAMQLQLHAAKKDDAPIDRRR